jgi:predicted ATPase/DNA-binding winged helix-turn-helix (wHTH) protein
MASAGAANDESRRFDGWEIRPRQRMLIVHGELVRTGSRAFDVLLALAQRPGQVVGKADLLDAAWPGLVVEENNLSVQISTLRKLLGPEAIVNISGVGYRLTSLPEQVGLPVAPPAGSPEFDVDRAMPELVGRETELQILGPRLGVAPLLNIVGTGGVGKTVLARALLATTRTSWRDGVHWIDLDAVPPGPPLLPLVAHTLGVLADDDALTHGDVLRSLSRLQALVVLDNCEHLAEAVADCLAPLLREAPGLRWLATSQQPLSLAGEELHRLAPLQVAAPDADAAQHRRCSAMALFTRRAASAELDDDECLGRAMDICRALDGLPLALEIAAARVATLGLRAVHEQLSSLLLMRHRRRDAPARHHSLDDTYAWSYGLLTPSEQQLFLSLQPFQDGFTLAQAQRLAADDEADAGTVADTLAALLDKSLVQRTPLGASAKPSRYRLFESAREFARLQLQAADEHEAVQKRHAEVVAATVDAAWPELLGSRDADWAARYLPERANVGAALTWACGSDDPALLARLVTACVLIDSFRDCESDSTVRGIPLALLRRAPPALRARACVELGWAYILHGNHQLAAELIEQAVQDSEATGDARCTFLSLTRRIRLFGGRPGGQERAQALWQRLMAIEAAKVPLRLKIYCQSTVGRHFGDLTTLEQLQHLAQLARQAGFDAQAAICLTNLTDELLLQGRYAEVVAATAELLRGDADRLRLHAFVSFNQAHALLRLGRVDEAREAARRVLRAMPGQAHTVIDLFALVAAQEARWRDAALMVGCSGRIQRERDWGADPAEAALIDETLKALREALGPAERERLFDLGATMAVADVLALADLA